MIPLPEKVLRLMSPEDRRLIGQQSASEAQCALCASLERRQQKLFASWLQYRELYYIQARSDKRSTIRVGHPDFTIFHNHKVLFIEMKSENGVLSTDQQECGLRLMKQGFVWLVCHNAREAIDQTKEFFKL
jgi:hypothetical protein